MLGVRAAARCSGAGAAPGPSCPLARAGVPRFGCPSLSFPAERAGKGSKGGLAASWLGLPRGARGEAQIAGGARGPGGAQPAPGEQRKEINQSQAPPPRPCTPGRRLGRGGTGGKGQVLRGAGGDVRRRVLSWNESRSRVWGEAAVQRPSGAELTPSPGFPNHPKNNRKGGRSSARRCRTRKGRFQAPAGAGGQPAPPQGQRPGCAAALPPGSGESPRGRRDRPLKLAQIKYLRHLMARSARLYLSFPSCPRRLLGYPLRLSPAALPVLLPYPKTVDDREENNFTDKMGGRGGGGAEYQWGLLFRNEP